MAKMEITRIPRSDTPLLVIGLGGTGIDVLSTIKRVFAERFEMPEDENGNPCSAPRLTEYLAIDIDSCMLKDYPEQEAVNIAVYEIGKLLAPGLREAVLSEDELSWLDPSLNGGYYVWAHRQAVRWMLSRRCGDVADAIERKLRAIVTDAPAPCVQIVIATGICGATGSGSFLDVAQIVRHCMRTCFAKKAYCMTGYIVMPDVTLADIYTGGEVMQNMLKANGYAALKELDFWMRVCDHHTPYEMQYWETNTTIAWTQPPFDRCFLVSGGSREEEKKHDGYNDIQNTIAQDLLCRMEDETGLCTMGSIPRFESDIEALCMMAQRPTPLFYGYRTMGVYTLRVPKREMMHYESMRLLSCFVPPRNADGELQPNDALLTDGKNRLRANAIIGDISELQKDVATRVALPSFAYKSDNELRNMVPPPHDRVNFADPVRWETETLPIAMAREAERYLQATWERFARFVEQVFTDPEQGPFSLQAYLQQPGENGLLWELKSALKDWASKQNNLVSKRPAMRKVCEDSYVASAKFPLFSAKDRYVDALKRYLAQVRAMALLDAFIPALTKLVKRVEEYLTHSLNVLCKDLENYYEMCLKPEKEDAPQVGTLFDFSLVQPDIDNAYATENTDRRLERQLLSKLYAACMQTAPSSEPKSSGVGFPFEKTHEKIVCDSLRETLDEGFGNINNQSLDDFMQSQIGANAEEQNRYMDDIVQKLLAHSVPLFDQTPAHEREPTTAYSLLCVPKNAQRFLEHYQNTLTPRVAVRADHVCDRLFLMTVWDGLPLYRYVVNNKYSKSRA